MGLAVGSSWFFDSRACKLVNSDIQMTPHKSKRRTEHNLERQDITCYKMIPGTGRVAVQDTVVLLIKTVLTRLCEATSRHVCPLVVLKLDKSGFSKD